MNANAGEGVPSDSVENDYALREQFVRRIESIVSVTGPAALNHVCGSMQVNSGVRDMEAAVLRQSPLRERYMTGMNSIIQFMSRAMPSSAASGPRPAVATGADGQSMYYGGQPASHMRVPTSSEPNAAQQQQQPPAAYAMSMQQQRARLTAPRIVAPGSVRQPTQQDLAALYQRLPANQQQLLNTKTQQEQQQILTRMWVETQLRQQQQQQRMSVPAPGRMANPNAQIQSGPLMGNEGPIPVTYAAANRMPMHSQPGGGRGMGPQSAAALQQQQQVYNRAPSLQPQQVQQAQQFAQQAAQQHAQQVAQQQYAQQQAQQQAVGSPASSASGTPSVATAGGDDAKYRSRVADLADKYLDTLRAIMQRNADERQPEDVRLKNLILVLEGKRNTSMEVLTRAESGMRSMCERHNQRTLTDSLFEAVRLAVKHNKATVLRGRLPDVWASVSDRKIAVPESVRRAAAAFDDEEAEHEAAAAATAAAAPPSSSCTAKRAKLEPADESTGGDERAASPSPTSLPAALAAELASHAVPVRCTRADGDGDTHVFVQLQLVGEDIPLLPPVIVRLPRDYPSQPLAADCCNLDSFEHSEQLRSLAAIWLQRFAERAANERTVSNLVADFERAAQLAALRSVCGDTLLLV